MKRIFRSLAALLIIVISFSAISFAWLASGKYLNFPSSFGGSATPAYFAGGDGSEKNPFRITNAVHLYNLAWLQYLGYFNRREGFNNDRDQTYFELGKDVDMRGRAIPPIGTEEYPFIGEFKGNGHKVTNLTISNKKGTDNLVKTPTNAKFSNNILRFVDDTKAHDIEIVGMFGVTGDYDGYFNKYKTAGHTVDGTIASVSNFYVDKIHVRSNSAKTLAGLAAGYIGGNFSNVGVYRSDIKFAANAQANGVAGEGVLSKYSLVGAYNEDLITWDDIGGTTGWGGSIDMKSLFTRLQGFKNRAAYVYPNFNDAANGSNRRFYDEKKGSVYYYSGDETLVRLYGGKIDKGYDYDNIVNDGLFISTGGKYLTINNLRTYGTGSVTDIGNAVTWFYNVAERSLYAYANGSLGTGDKIYLNMNVSGTLQLSTVQTLQWVKVGNNQFYTTMPYGNSTITYYLDYVSQRNAWAGNRTPSNITLTPSNNILRYYSPTYTYSGTVNNGSETRNFATYVPLLVDNDGNVIKENTGYIASGSTTTLSGTVTGDIRIRRDDVRTAFSNSLTNGSSYGVNSSLKIYTRTAKSGGFVSFTDAYGSSTSGKKLNLVKYENAKANFDALFADSATYVYGMHFMNAPISIKNVYKADYAMINGEEYKDGNYQMVANAIDFKAKKKGHINFFSGTYYNGADKNFFSLHEIKRNGNNITEIKSISKIYAHKTNSKADYIYLYDDNTYSSSDYSEAIYELVFDVDWITNPEMNMYSVYYFEIPVNKGEFALGSASTGDGAYLMYLDIGANGNTDGDEENYTMDKVRFVNSNMPTLNGAVDVSAYEPALITLSGSSTAEEIAVFKRDEQETDGKLKLAYRIINNNANAITVTETTTGITRKDTTLTPSTDDEP